MKNTNKIYIFLIVMATVVVLIYAQKIIIPFILAILFWFLIRVIKKVLSKVKFIKGLPKWILTVISSVLLLTFLVFTVTMISKNIQQLSGTIPIYEANVNKIANSINQQFDIDIVSMLGDFAQDLNFGNILKSIFSRMPSLLILNLKVVGFFGG